AREREHRLLRRPAHRHLPAGAEPGLLAHDRRPPDGTGGEERRQQLLGALLPLGELPRAGEVQQRAGPARAGVEMRAAHPRSLRGDRPDPPAALSTAQANHSVGGPSESSTENTTAITMIAITPASTGRRS